LIRHRRCRTAVRGERAMRILLLVIAANVLLYLLVGTGE
jgi:hypothetical protein